MTGIGTPGRARAPFLAPAGGPAGARTSGAAASRGGGPYAGGGGPLRGGDEARPARVGGGAGRPPGQRHGYDERARREVLPRREDGADQGLGSGDDIGPSGDQRQEEQVSDE